MEIVLHHVKTAPVPPSQRLGRAVPRRLEEIVLSCMANEPEQRPRSAEEQAERLAACEFEEPWTSERARACWSAHGPDPDGSAWEPSGTTATLRQRDDEPGVGT